MTVNTYLLLDVCIPTFRDFLVHCDQILLLNQQGKIFLTDMPPWYCNCVSWRACVCLWQRC